MWIEWGGKLNLWESLAKNDMLEMARGTFNFWWFCKGLKPRSRTLTRRESDPCQLDQVGHPTQSNWVGFQLFFDFLEGVKEKEKKWVGIRKGWDWTTRSARANELVFFCYWKIGFEEKEKEGNEVDKIMGEMGWWNKRWFVVCNFGGCGGEWNYCKEFWQSD